MSDVDPVRLAAEAVVRAVDDPGPRPDVHAQTVGQTVRAWPGLMRRVDDLRTALQRTGGP
jgi:hypothetical protein